MSKILSADSGRRLWHSRWVRWPIWVMAALLVLLSLTWLAVPPLVKWQGQKIATEKLGRSVHIGAVQFKPWLLELTLRDVTVGGAKPADPPQFAAKRLSANLSLESIWRLAPVVGTIEIDQPALRLRHLGGGHYDVDDVIARLTSGPKPPPSEKPTRFALYDITVQGGRITFIDDPVQRIHEVRDLRLTLPFISNLPSQRQVHVAPQLAFTVDGSRFDSGAQTLPFDASYRTQAHLRLQRLDLTPYLVYQPANLPLHMAAGALDADLRLTFQATPKPSLQITGVAHLSGVKVDDPTGHQALAFERLTIDASNVRPLEHVVHLTSVELIAPHVLTSRDAQGQLNWVQASSAPPATTSITTASGTARAPKTAARPAPEASAADDWHVTVDRVAIAQGDVQWRDASPTPGYVGKTGPATVHIAPFTFEAQNITWPATQPATFSGRMVLAGMMADQPTRQRPATPVSSGKRGGRPAVIAPNAASVPSIAFQGQAQTSAAKLSMQARGLPLLLARPYLATVLKPSLTGNVDADADVIWSAPESGDSGHDAGKGSGAAASDLTVQASKLALSHLALLGGTDHAPTASRRHRADNLPPGTLASIGALTLEGAKLDLGNRSVAVDAVTVQAPRVQIARSRDGRWMFQDWLVQSDANREHGRQHQASPDQPQPWAVRLGHIAVADGGIGWRDQQPASGAVDVALSRLKLDARDFELGGRKPIPLVLSGLLAPRHGEPGQLRWRGTVGLAPISAQGQLDAERLPLQTFEPYVAGLLNIDILRADASFKGRVSYAQQNAGPHLHVAGDARIEKLRITSHPGSAAANDAKPSSANVKSAQDIAASRPETAASSQANGATATAATVIPPAPPASSALTSGAALAPDGTAAPGGIDEELLSWEQLQVAGLNVRLDPGQAPQVTVKDSQLSDFYARVIVHPNGRINLQDLIKSTAPTQTASAPALAPAPASAASGADMPSSDAPVINLGPTSLVNGRVAFSDHFIRPNYSANLTELNGSLGAFSSVTNPQTPQMADLQLTGHAEGTAQLTVNGKLNPLAHPLALDIAAKVTDLELPPLSPYAVKYSGHGIERGKLSMNVAYKIAPDGQLTATNKLVLNQLQFGSQVPGAPASLPVTLATTLLADSNGVIDLDLPISGSLNDPQFSIGPIIFKAIINLIGKAITAPFSLLAHALGGGGSDMSQVPFAPGSAALSDAAQVQLNKIAKAMADRPKLKLTVTGTARLDQERDGLKRERLKALVAAERHASDGSDDTETAALDTASPLAFTVSGAASDAVPAASAPTATASGVASSAASATDYPQLLQRLYRRTDIPGKPRNLIGMTKNVPVAQMEKLLLAHISVTVDDIRQLATQRAIAVKDYLLAQHLSADRVFIGAANADGPDQAADGAKKPAPAAESASPAESTASEAASAVTSASARWTPHARLELSTQ